MDFGVFFAGLVSGALIGPFFGWMVFVRLSRRLARHLEMEHLAEELERRRETHDSGRTEQVRPGAGRVAKQTNLFATHPGSLELNRRAEEVRKLREKLASLHNSGMLEESGSESSGD